MSNKFQQQAYHGRNSNALRHGGNNAKQVKNQLEFQKWVLSNQKPNRELRRKYGIK